MRGAIFGIVALAVAAGATADDRAPVDRAEAAAIRAEAAADRSEAAARRVEDAAARLERAVDSFEQRRAAEAGRRPRGKE